MSIIRENFSERKRWEDYDTIKCPDGQIIDMQKMLDEQERAKAALNHVMPALGGFIGRLRYVYTFRIPTQATDGYNILANPQFTANLDLTGKVFVMAHEILHCLLNHLRRGAGHDHTRSNIAADYECNITLAEFDIIKIDVMKKLGAYVDKKYAGWGYEKIYDDIGPQNSQDNMDNSDQANQAKQNQKYDPDFIKGWNKAMEDYKNGKIKI